MSKKAKTTIEYRLTFRTNGCYDDGGPTPGHDIVWYDLSSALDARSERKAITEIAERIRKDAHSKSSCYCHTKEFIPKELKEVTTISIDDQVMQTTERFIPDFMARVERALARTQPRRCLCGRLYWPHKGEKRCHELVQV